MHKVKQCKKAAMEKIHKIVYTGGGREGEGQKMMFQANRLLRQAVTAVVTSEQENNQK